MQPTSTSLLDRLRLAPPDDPAWPRFQTLYLPWVRRWIARVPGLEPEADDLAQDVLLVVVRELPAFERRRDGSFRCWLRRVAVNRIRTFCRARRRRPLAGLDATGDFLDRLADPDDALAREWDREHDQHVFQSLLANVRPDFSPTTWEAFRRFALGEEPAAAVARDLGISENAVIQAKSRILKRLREEAGDLIG